MYTFVFIIKKEIMKKMLLMLLVIVVTITTSCKKDKPEINAPLGCLIVVEKLRDIVTEKNSYRYVDYYIMYKIRDNDEASLMKVTEEIFTKHNVGNFICDVADEEFYSSEIR